MAHNDCIIKADYLQKESQYKKEYRRRWIVLKNHFLYCYRSQDMQNKPTESFNLSVYNTFQGGTVSNENETNDNDMYTRFLMRMRPTFTYKFTIISAKTKKNKRTFQVSSKQEMLDWITKLKDECLYKIHIDIKIIYISSSIFKSKTNYQLDVTVQDNRDRQSILYNKKNAQMVVSCYIRKLSIHLQNNQLFWTFNSNVLITLLCKFILLPSAYSAITIVKGIANKSISMTMENVQEIIQNWLRIHNIVDVAKWGLKIQMEMGYLERKPIWNMHNKGISMMLIGHQKYVKFYGEQFHISSKKGIPDDLVSMISEVPGPGGAEMFKESTLIQVTVSVVNNNAFDCEFYLHPKKETNMDRIFDDSIFDDFHGCARLRNIGKVICDKMNSLYSPTTFGFISSDDVSTVDLKNNTKMKKSAVSLKVNSYQHNVSNVFITCPHLKPYQDTQNSIQENKEKYCDMLQLKCHIYKAMKIKYNYTEDNLNHLLEYTHFKDEVTEKQPCKYFEKCNAFIRLENGENRFDDRCHIQLYRHPPRNRQLQLSDDINSFIINQNQAENHELFKPSSYNKIGVNEKDGYLKQLISEVIRNGYKEDLCLTDYDAKRNIYSIIDIVDHKMYTKRHISMGCPLNRGQMLALIMYTGCDANYDLCKHQRSGDYKKWKYFDLCLWNAICKLKQKETGRFKVYTGLTNVKINKKTVKNGYFKTYVSTSWKKEVSQKFMGDKGMIIQLDESFRKDMICCDVSWISKFPDECEVLIARSIENKNNFECKIMDEKNGIQTALLVAKRIDTKVPVQK